jgi:hypothetical protein
MCLLHEPALYCLACAESRVGCQWDRVIFSNMPAFRSANNGLVLVHVPKILCAIVMCPLLGMKGLESCIVEGHPDDIQ